ncbi:MAG: zinc ribbon domain-containing protein [Candidatus Heimdallarchaeota archaeon]|nr:zinc ribbon domain-containing protein [Candidatus Heimdallarchaeota archaeon]
MEQKLSDQEQAVQQFVTKERKVKINWLLTVTFLSIDELVLIANKLGYIIKGEYIALPSEEGKLREPQPWKPIDQEPLRKPTIRPIKRPRRPKNDIKIDYRFCISCGIALKDSGQVYYLDGFCQNCGEDLDEIFNEDKSINPYHKKRCSDCGTINPTKANFCHYCGSENINSIL